MTKTPIFKGSCTAIVTPFCKNGIDFERFGKLMDFQYDNGTNALVVCGTTGENATMSAYEHEELVDFACKHNNGRMKIIVGVGGSDIEGEWEATVLRTENGSTKAYNALDPLSLVFYDDGTGDEIVYAGIRSFSYKCHGDTLVIDGEELQYEIKGDILKITDDEGTTLTLRRK